ncbi:MAG: rhodanese-related sulfurtransferase [Sphingobium sp.]
MIDPSQNSSVLTVAALYRFARFPDPERLRPPLLTLCKDHGVKGTLLLAQEGINGTIAGSADAIAAVIAHIRDLPDCATLDVKYSTAQTMPFGRMKVRLKREIVTMGKPDLDPAHQAGIHVDPAEWNRLLSDPDTVVIDTRNAYEVAIGSFDGAIDPKTQSFREFPGWLDAFTADLAAEGRKPRIAMFCTGGIRCEKSTAYAKSLGLKDVYHLNGGILRYLEEIPQQDSRWQGECFVFDERVSVGHGLQPGRHVTCRSCGAAIPENDAPHDCTIIHQG